jgi:hypothetical protein
MFAVATLVPQRVQNRSRGIKSLPQFEQVAIRFLPKPTLHRPPMEAAAA